MSSSGSLCVLSSRLLTPSLRLLLWDASLLVVGLGYLGRVTEETSTSADARTCTWTGRGYYKRCKAFFRFIICYAEIKTNTTDTSTSGSGSGSVAYPFVLPPIAFETGHHNKYELRRQNNHIPTPVQPPLSSPHALTHPPRSRHKNPPDPYPPRRARHTLLPPPTNALPPSPLSPPTAEFKFKPRAAV